MCFCPVEVSHLCVFLVYQRVFFSAYLDLFAIGRHRPVLANMMEYQTVYVGLSMVHFLPCFCAGLNNECFFSFTFSSGARYYLLWMLIIDGSRFFNCLFDCCLTSIVTQHWTRFISVPVDP